MPEDRKIRPSGEDADRGEVAGRGERDHELREARHMLQSVLDTIPVRVFWKDLDSVYLGCNQLFAADAGLESPAAIVGKLDSELGWREQSERYRADDAEVMRTGRSKLGYEEPQTTPGGSQIWLRTSKVPLRDHSGRAIGVLGTYEDITASKQAEAERRGIEARIQHMQKLESLGILAGGIAHDFNNLLVAILGHAELALIDAPSGEGERRHLEGIKTAALRARELTNQMLAYSGRGRFRVRKVQLNDVIRETGSLLEASIPKKVKLTLALAEGLPVVEADATQIRQVVMNLVTNAAEAVGEAEGEIVLTTDVLAVAGSRRASGQQQEPLAEGDYVRLEVADDGAGMDEETQRRLFEPFFTTKFHGRGLGLAAVQGIVRGHGGAIEVASTEGTGSTIRVLLPAAVGSPERERASQPSRAAEPLTGTVLVVDDEDSVREIAVQVLERLGFSVIPAADGQEALAAFERHADEIDLVLLDMTMPRMDGAETFRALRRRAPDLCVILASGYDEQDAREHFSGSGLAGFVQKPFTLADLEAKLREVMD